MATSRCTNGQARETCSNESLGVLLLLILSRPEDLSDRSRRCRHLLALLWMKTLLLLLLLLIFVLLLHLVLLLRYHRRSRHRYPMLENRHRPFPPTTTKCARLIFVTFNAVLKHFSGFESHVCFDYHGCTAYTMCVSVCDVFSLNIVACRLVVVECCSLSWTSQFGSC